MNMQEESELQRAQRLAIVEAFAAIVKDKRTDAIEGRRASGIETIWAEDEAHYEGQDEVQESAYSKGKSASDGLSEKPKKQTTRSTAFLNITRPYCDAASASMSDMLMPTDDRNWDMRLTPIGDLKASLNDNRSVAEVVPQAVAAKQGGIRGAIGKLFSPAQPTPQKAPTVAEVAKQEMDRATVALDAARKQVDDWLVECRYHAEVRKQIEATARIGTGILKGPTPARKKARKATHTKDGWTVEINIETKPESKEVSAWKIYPDPACGDNIHNGSYIFEEDEITARRLNELKGGGYIDEMIDLCIKEGPISAVTGTSARKPEDKTRDKDLFQIWYYYGHASKDDMTAAGCSCGDKERSYYPVQVTMVNDRIIKVALSPLDSGEFPYDVMVWQAVSGSWTGTGVARQMRTCQKGANAAVRNLMDNAGLAGGPQTIVDRTKIVPANGKWELTPRKVWWTKDGAEMMDVRTAFIFVVVPMLQNELLALAQFWIKEAEDVTGLPALLQGQQGSAPETVGGMTLLNNNANTVKRRIARTFDDRVTEPHIGRYYEYLLLHGPDDCKGDFTIDARGSSALVERDAQTQQMPQMLNMSVNPVFGLDPESVMDEMLKGMRFDTKRLKLSDEKKQQMAQQQPPPPPQIAVAQIREEGALKRKQMELQAKAQQGDADRALNKALKDIDAQLEGQSLDAEERRDLQKHKVALASLTMELRQQRELSPGPQVRTPPTEPFGRAPDGMAYPQ